MRKFILLFILFPTIVSAHGGRSALLTVNNEPARANSLIDDITSSVFVLPSEIAPKSYIAGDLVTLTVDTTLSLKPVGSPYVWQFGDGLQASGLSVSHRFGKPGTYVVSVSTQAQSVATLSIAILPNTSAVLPKAKISANGKVIEDLLIDYLEIQPGKKVVFDAGGSTGSIRIYQWDFGDKTTGEGKTISHTYKRDTFFPVSALLRVTDENGIMGDAAVIIDTPLGNPSPLAGLFDAIREFFTNLFAKK